MRPAHSELGPAHSRTQSLSSYPPVPPNTGATPSMASASGMASPALSAVNEQLLPFALFPSVFNSPTTETQKDSSPASTSNCQGVLENSKWAEDFEHAMERALAHLKRLAEDDHYTEPHLSVDQHIELRLHEMRDKIPDLAYLMRVPGGHEMKGLANEAKDLAKELTKKLDGLIGEIGEMRQDIGELKAEVKGLTALSKGSREDEMALE